jgi:hypothetical protein
MDVFWLTPRAWWGIAALAIPVVIHLLTRQQTRRVLFPTLRFLRPTRLAALRRRSIHDWPLLTVRILVLLAAVAALAGPVFVSSERQAEWQQRTARALVIAPAQSDAAMEQDALIADETGSSFASAVFRPSEHLADGLRDAAAWLDEQPPAFLEIVIAGDLKEGAIAEPDLEMIPPAVGLRFLPTPAAGGTSTLRLQLGRATAADVALLDNSTRAIYSGAARPEAPATRDLPISVRAAPGDQAFASAALDAVVSRGVRLDRAGSRRVLVVFAGGDVRDLPLQQPAAAAWMRAALSGLPGMSGGQREETLVVLTNQRANDPGAVHVIDRVARAAFAEDLTALEPRRIPAATLARWSRPPGPVEGALPADEGDRRWFWGAALLLLVIEALVRRRSSTADMRAGFESEKQVA